MPIQSKTGKGTDMEDTACTVVAIEIRQCNVQRVVTTNITRSGKRDAPLWSELKPNRAQERSWFDIWVWGVESKSGSAYGPSSTRQPSLEGLASMRALAASHLKCLHIGTSSTTTREEKYGLGCVAVIRGSDSCIGLAYRHPILSPQHSMKIRISSY
jgi:hypothetical protein